MGNIVNTKFDDFKLKFAEEKDTGAILGFIKELAEYENMSNEVLATEEILKNSLFNRKVAEAVIGEYKGEPIGFILFFHNCSTFMGKPGIYLEDLYIQPHMRGKGFGKVFLSFLAKLAVERDCARLEWSCLDWNEPSIKFYKSLGAIPMDEWTVYRLHKESLNSLADKF